MPFTYDYRCEKCGSVEEDLRAKEDIERPIPCECGGDKVRQFAYTAGVRVFQPYYDEGLGCDIHGTRHRKQVMSSMNVQEAGDTVGGSRNEDSVMTGIASLRGVNHSDIQRKEERAARQRDNMVVTFTKKDGSETHARHGDLQTDTKKSLKIKRRS